MRHRTCDARNWTDMAPTTRWGEVNLFCKIDPTGWKMFGLRTIYDIPHTQLSAIHSSTRSGSNYFRGHQARAVSDMQMYKVRWQSVDGLPDKTFSLVVLFALFIVYIVMVNQWLPHARHTSNFRFHLVWQSRTEREAVLELDCLLMLSQFTL